MSKIKLLLVLCAICFLGGQAKAQVVLSSCNQTYTQNFNTLETTDQLNIAALATPYEPISSSWYVSSSSTADYYGADNGTLLSQGARNYHSTNSVDYSLGNYAEGGTNYIGLRLENQTGTTITSFTITYTGEQWRRGNNGSSANMLRFAYRTSANDITNFGSTYTLVSALDFKAPQNVSGGVCNNSGIALNGNLAANRKTMSATITLATPLANGSEIMLRWQDLNHSCGDHGLSIDDVSVSFSTAPQVAGTISGSTTVCAGSQYAYEINGTVGTPSAVDQDGINLTVTQDGNLILVDVTNTTTSFTVTNTLVNMCNEETSKSLTVNVLPAPVANVAPSLINQSCNTVTLSLSTLDFSDKIVRWEYSTDGGVLWETINSANTTINYTITTNTVFRAIITRANSTCYEVATPATLPIGAVNAPTLATPVVSGDCSTSSITIETSNNAYYGVFTISPNPRNVSPIEGTTATYTNLPAGTYVITFLDYATGCQITRSVTTNGAMLMMPNLYPEPYAVSRTSITPEWQKYTGASSYQLQYKKTFGGPTTTISGITTLRRAVTNLLCNTSYDFRIRALCSSGKYSPYTSWMTWSTQACIAREASWSNDGEFSLYPNPNNGNFNISFDAENGNTGTVSVVDLNGKAVTTHDFTAIDGANSINMNLNGVAQGIYLVRFQMGDVIKTQKIVVE